MEYYTVVFVNKDVDYLCILTHKQCKLILKDSNRIMDKVVQISHLYLRKKLVMLYYVPSALH